MNVYALTPTGCRPEGLALLGEYINAQTYRGPLTWVVVDDCDPATRVPRMREGVTVDRVRPSWRWLPGKNTQGACLLAGLARVPGTAKLLILEDDDVYLPRYLETMLDALDTVEAVGERVARYYNVASSRYRTLPGTHHASLAATGVQGTGLQALTETCRVSGQRIDIRFWRGFQGSKLFLDTSNVVGIKGLPGRPGIGVGHRNNFGTPDNGAVLQTWVGDYADNYDMFRRVA